MSVVSAGRVGETKPFYKTSEFWLSMLAFIPMFLNTVDIVSLVPDRYAAIATAIVGLGYSLSRGVAKSGVPYEPPEPN